MCVCGRRPACGALWRMTFQSWRRLWSWSRRPKALSWGPLYCDASVWPHAGCGNNNDKWAEVAVWCRRESWSFDLCTRFRVAVRYTVCIHRGKFGLQKDFCAQEPGLPQPRLVTRPIQSGPCSTREVCVCVFFRCFSDPNLSISLNGYWFLCRTFCF